MNTCVILEIFDKNKYYNIDAHMCLKPPFIKVFIVGNKRSYFLFLHGQTLEKVTALNNRSL